MSDCDLNGAGWLLLSEAERNQLRKSPRGLPLTKGQASAKQTPVNQPKPGQPETTP